MVTFEAGAAGEALVGGRPRRSRCWGARANPGYLAEVLQVCGCLYEFQSSLSTGEWAAVDASWLPDLVEPARDLVRIEADEAADFEIWESPFGDLAANMADGDAEVFGELLDGEEVGGERRGTGHV